MNIRLITTAVALSALAGANAIETATAQTIYLGLQENGGAINLEDTYTSDADSGIAANIKFDSSTKVAVLSGGDAQTDGFGSQVSATINNKSTGTETFTVYLTEVGVSGSVGQIKFQSILQALKLPSNWTLTESIYVNTNDQIFATEHQVATEFFTSTGSSGLISDTLTIIPPYSVTEVFTFTVAAKSSGTSWAEAIVTDPAVPEVSTWGMMLAGFAGLGLVGHRRNKAATLAA